MRRLAALGLAAVLLVAAGCSAAPADPRIAEVRSVVRRYDTLLAKGFAELDMNALAPVATRDQAYTEYYQMAAIGESKVRLLATLRSLEFGETSFSSDTTATAVTTEVWDYRQMSTETSALVGTQTGVTYHLSYQLVLQDGRWLVDSVKSTDATGTSGAGGSARP